MTDEEIQELIDNPEDTWGGRPSNRVLRNWVIMVFLLIGMYAFHRAPELRSLAGVPDMPYEVRRALVEPDKEWETVLRRKLVESEAVARAFIEADDGESRLQWVRNPELVRSHMEAYSVEAREAPGEIVGTRGCALVEGQIVAGFVVALPRERYHLLELVEMEEGWRVDWDSYARYCSSTWDDLLSGAVTEAEVRVFVSPCSYYNPPFLDESKWTSFQFTSQDLNHRVVAYAERDSLVARNLRSAVMASPRFRQHVTLQVSRHGGLNDEPLFRIDRVLAVGWIRWERDAEEIWRGAQTAPE